MISIAGRLVLVTGASSGIGAAAARAMAHKGARVILVARTQSALDVVAAEIRAAGGDARVYALDLADAAAVCRTAETIQRENGVPDILVNNAGAGRWLWIDETSPEEAVQMMAVPYFGAFFITSALLPGMLRRGRGHVVNITTPVAFVAWAGATGYAAARWAMRGFNEALRAELRNTGVTVTLVTPGLVETSYFAHNPGGQHRVPGIAKLFRTLTPDDVGTAIVTAVEKERRYVFLPPLLGLVVKLHRLLPGLVEWIVFKSGARRAHAS